MLLLAYWQRNDGGHTIPCQLAIITIIIIIMGATQTRARHHYSQYCRLAFLHTAAGAPFSHQIYTYLHVRGIAYTCTGSWHGRASALCTHCTCRCSVRTRTLWFTYTKQCINEIIFRIGICLLVVFPPPPFFIHWWLCSIFAILRCLNYNKHMANDQTTMCIVWCIRGVRVHHLFAQFVWMCCMLSSAMPRVNAARAFFCVVPSDPVLLLTTTNDTRVHNTRETKTKERKELKYLWNCNKQQATSVDKHQKQCASRASDVSALSVGFQVNHSTPILSQPCAVTLGIVYLRDFANRQ